MLLTMMKTNVRERSGMRKRTIETPVHDAKNDKIKVNGASSSKTKESKQNFGDDRNEKKSETDESYSDRNKFKKVGCLCSPAKIRIRGYFMPKEEYRNLFDKLVAPLSDLPERVVEDTFMNGLLPWIRAEVAFCRPKSLAKMMEVAKLVENKEIFRREANLNGYSDRKNSVQAFGENKVVTNNATGEIKGNTSFLIRTITLKSPGPNENRREGTYKRLSNAEFQIRKEKGLCFRCNEKYSADHKCKMKDHLELRMFVVANDKEELEIVDREEVEKGELNKLEVKGDTTTFVELLINSVVGLNDLGTMKVRGKLRDENVIILINCGATHNFVSEKLVKKLLIPIKETAHYGVILGSGAAVQGMQWLHSLGGVEDEGFLVDCRAVELATPTDNDCYMAHMEIGVDGSLSTVLKQFEDVFKWPEKLPPRREIEHQIHLKQRADPINVRPYVMGFNIRKKWKNWTVNNATILDKFPIPVVEELFDELSGAVVFFKIDLKLGYHQIRMVDEDIEKTASRTHKGHYEFLVMLFGLTNAPATFQALMNTIFKPFFRKFVLVFFDDILVYSRDTVDHVEHMRKVLSVLREHELYANKKKCSFAQHKVEYLGHIISGEGVEVDSKKIKSITKWPKPTNIKEVRGFFRLTRYYRRFVQNYGAIAAPLTQLLKMGDINGDAFEQLKKAMSSLPMLALLDFNQPFEIEIDASCYGVGAVLIQAKRPITYYSHTLALRDRARPVYERELMIVRVIQPQYQNWIAKLLGYSFEVVYKPSVENRAANALSRMPAEVELKGLSVLVTVDLELIKKEVHQDPKFQKLMVELRELEDRQGSKYSHQNDVLKYKDRVEEIDRIYDFLAGHNSKFDIVRGRILGQRPIPSLIEVYFAIHLEEDCTNAMNILTILAIDSAAFSVRSSTNGSEKIMGNQSMIIARNNGILRSNVGSYMVILQEVYLSPSVLLVLIGRNHGFWILVP
ncbi:Transposon Tf2-9 polyprotein [Cucumis melo var. makuwa]|uniref:Transposon Tf2-9 polyprotein n=1 Tax=Cucumis melo var. makuwa TaxID=1194695 RepID=A0A5A7SUI3_CUCMM|nr:Transposon Tf2-9 polyprotein [Cucumis melo var. makuwa]